jgi:hypothetical protein
MTLDVKLVSHLELGSEIDAGHHRSGKEVAYFAYFLFGH